jgi:predicted membrane-bound spermidine synthase
MNKKFLFLLIFCEGYIVLASELISIRQLIPFIGSGTEVISIIIGAVLLSMALGYHYGGVKNITNIRKNLIKNFLISQFILTLGLSYVFIELFHQSYLLLGLTSKIGFCFLYSTIFIAIPIFLLAQTVPLISNYFSKKISRKITANILFFSTLGSFLGSIFTTLVVMQYLGVNYALIITIVNFVILIAILAKKQFYYEVIFSIFIFGFCCMLNSSNLLKTLNMVSANQYSNIIIKDIPEISGKNMNINNSNSSLYVPNPEDNFEYAEYINNNFLYPLINQTKDILIIGAGAFTLGYEDDTNLYDYIDIDKSLKNIAEKYVLPKKLGNNKNFIVDSALSYLKNNNKKYDLIIVDAYSNELNIPLEVSVTEFWQTIKLRLKPQSIVVANIIASPIFNDKFSIRVDNSFRMAFNNYNRHVIKNIHLENNQYHNIIYSYYHNDLSGDKSVYTLNKTTYSIDTK